MISFHKAHGAQYCIGFFAEKALLIIMGLMRTDAEAEAAYIGFFIMLRGLLGKRRGNKIARGG